MADAAPDFLSAARAFREALVAEDVGEREFARLVRNALARVYLAAALLGPPTAVESDDAPPEERPGAEESAVVRGQLKARFGESDVFVEVDDPAGIDGRPRVSHGRSLSWELVEIDEDLAEAIAWLEQQGTDALRDVRWAFENHWGRHAVACLRPLHQLTTYGVV